MTPWAVTEIAILYVLAALGALCLVSSGILTGFHTILHKTDREAIVVAPGGKLRAIREVTRGGFGTVWTTRIFVLDGAGERRSIYSTGDSDYVPFMRWTDPERLDLSIHWGRIEHLGSSAAYTKGGSPVQRFGVRFIYDKAMCNRPPAGDR